MSNSNQLSPNSATIFKTEHAELAQQGVKFLLLHGVKPDGSCTCYRGRDCVSPGKHPEASSNWAATATDDEDRLCEIFESHPGYNIGILLGPESGVIDIEFDSDEGRATADRLFAGIETPTYESARSVHRLFKWPKDQFPFVQKLTPKDGPLAGLEIRIGGGDKQTQSVAPGSTHPSGCEYEWLPGLSPVDVPLASPPREIIGVLRNYDPNQPESISSGKGRSTAAVEIIPDGQRNDLLFRFACDLANRFRLNVEAERAALLGIVKAKNIASCRPPLDDREVSNLVESAICQARRGGSHGSLAPSEEGREEAEGKPKQSFDWGWHCEPVSGTYFPGDWKLFVVTATPQFYQLEIPAIAHWTEAKNGLIEISEEAISNPDLVARAIRVQTQGRGVVNRVPGLWPKIWCGCRPTKNSPNGTPGLWSHLVDEMQTLAPDFYDEEFRPWAQHLLGWLNTYAWNSQEFYLKWVTDEGGKRESVRVDTPGEEHANESDATRFRNGDILFRWEAPWADMLKRREITKEQVRDFRRRLGIGSVKGAKCPYTVKNRKTNNRRFLKFPPWKMEEVRRMAEGGDID